MAQTTEQIDDGSRKKLFQFIDEFCQTTLNWKQKETVPNTASPECSTILLYGKHKAKLQLFAFIFGQKLVAHASSEINIIRSNNIVELLPRIIDVAGNDISLPSLFLTSEMVDDYHSLDLLRVVYLKNRTQLIEYLLNTSDCNEDYMMPVGLIVDNIVDYLRASTEEDDDEDGGENGGHSQDTAEMLGPAKKRVRLYGEQTSFSTLPARPNNDLESLCQLCSLMIETLQHCSSRQQTPTFLVVTIDLDSLTHQITESLSKSLVSEAETDSSIHLASVERLCKSMLFQLERRFFVNKINVDEI